MDWAARLIQKIGAVLRLSRMRAILLLSLLALSFGLTSGSLLAVRFTVNRQISRDLSRDLQHSVDTFRNLELQRREMLAREAALLADLPNLKALMTTQDARTIQDGSRAFWQISGSNLFQLYDRGGQLVATYGPGQSSMGMPEVHRSQQAMSTVIDELQKTRTVAVGDTLYEVIAQPLSFGPRVDGTLLGYVVLGSAIDQRVAREVSQAAAAEVAFTIDGVVAVSTLTRASQAALNRNPALQSLASGAVCDIALDRERYLAFVMPLDAPTSVEGGQVRLVVLRSYAEATRLVSTLNRWLLGLGSLALLVGAVIATSIARRVTQPLEALVEGARALGRGDFNKEVSVVAGTAEIRELSQAFDHMRSELRTSQRALVDSERLATIGRMANSISHDLRHYISAMYANAEFLSLASTPQTEREELIFEVQTAVHGMTDMLDSLLGFSKTGKALMPSYESVPYLVERAVALLRAHPEAHSLKIHLEPLPSVEAWLDATKFVRAVFNLLLNACQAANRGSLVPCVRVDLSEDDHEIVLKVQDSGAGIPPALISTMFEPFVSRGRENGIGLGLTLAQHIARDHGGLITLEESTPGRTVFALRLDKDALSRLSNAYLVGLPSAESQ